MTASPLPTDSFHGAWNLVYVAVRAFWALTEPRIHAAAQAKNIPIELYYYAEFGLEIFSVERFQKRDPYSNPALFTATFEKLAQAEWIIPQGGGVYRVTDDARAAARELVRAGDGALEQLEFMSAVDATRLVERLRRIVRANEMAPEPPAKWAILERFRAVAENAPRLAWVREALLDLFAYRDDSHRAAWQSFPADGLMWHTFNLVWDNVADTPSDMAQQASLRGYAVEDYVRACNQLTARGWLGRDERPGAFALTPIGRKLRGAVEQLTDAYFYLAWTNLHSSELDALLADLRQLRAHLETAALHDV